MTANIPALPKYVDRREFIGGSGARIIMGDNQAALLRLSREKRGEVEPEDLSGDLIVQLGVVTEPLNRRWFERNPGRHALSSVHISAHRGSFVVFNFNRFPEAHPRPSPVPVDELDASRLQRDSDFFYRFLSPTQFSIRSLKTSDRGFRTPRACRQSGLGPTEQRTGSFDLSDRNQCAPPY